MGLFGVPNEWPLRLCFWPLDGDRVACCSRILFRRLSRDVPNFPRDRYGLKRVGSGKLLQKLLNLCGLVIFDGHINLSLVR